MVLPSGPHRATPRSGGAGTNHCAAILGLAVPGAWSVSDAKRPARNRATSATLPPIDAESFLFAHGGPALVLDRQGHVLSANTSALRLLGAATLSQVQQR